MYDREILTELNQNYHYNQLNSNNNNTEILFESSIMRSNEYNNNNNNNNNSYFQYEDENQCSTEMMNYEQQQMYYYNKQLVLKSKLEKRNARERKRVQQVNLEFQKLRKLLINVKTKNKQQEEKMDFDEDFDETPNSQINSNKRISKVKTLRCAIDYIKHLQDILINDNDCQSGKICFSEEIEPSCSTSVSSNVDSSLDLSINNEYLQNINFNGTNQDKNFSYFQYPAVKYESQSYTNTNFNYYEQNLMNNNFLYQNYTNQFFQ
jgi:hypothetical protein